MKHELRSDTEVAERVNIIGMELFKQLNLRFTGRPVNASTVREVREFLSSVKTRAMLQGVAMPDLTVLPFPRRGGLEVVRQDLDVAGIERLIRRLRAKYRGVSDAEIAYAVRCGFPGRAGVALV